MKTILRVLTPYEITLDDSNRAKQIPNAACPRRYCWWWKSLSFEWEVQVIDGCSYPNIAKPPGWKHGCIPCKRAIADSRIDQFEPRDSAIIEDCMPLNGWDIPVQPSWTEEL